MSYYNDAVGGYKNLTPSPPGSGEARGSNQSDDILDSFSGSPGKQTLLSDAAGLRKRSSTHSSGKSVALSRQLQDYKSQLVRLKAEKEKALQSAKRENEQLSRSIEDRRRQSSLTPSGASVDSVGGNSRPAHVENGNGHAAGIGGKQYKDDDEYDHVVLGSEFLQGPAATNNMGEFNHRRSTAAETAIGVEAGLGSITKECRASDLTQDHLKLLYLISKFSSSASQEGEKERWIRRMPLLVLIFEGIVKGVFNYDYAPMSDIVGHRRIYLNVSQEGRDDIDDLRVGGFIKGLKINRSSGHATTTAYQLSWKGMKGLKYVDAESRELIDNLVYAPSSERTESDLLNVFWNGSEYFLASDKGFWVRSTVTDCEDVSYVCSPYIPKALKRASLPMTCNASRAFESAAGATTIRDDVEELIKIGGVRMLIGEWVPFGANQVVTLNDKLGSSERVSTGFYTQLTDQNNNDTQLEIDQGLTSVTVLDWHQTRYLNFEAEVFYPEEKDVIQVENIGVHVQCDGTIAYGLVLESIADRVKDDISLDFLSRLLIDVQQDTSHLMDSVLSTYQRALLETVFNGDAIHRDKFTIFMAESINPILPAENYLDKEGMENELKQIIGDTHGGFDVSDGEVIMIGRQGILYAGGNMERYEGILVIYLGLMSLDIFIKNFYIRTFMLSDGLSDIRSTINNYQKDPNSISRIRARLSKASNDVITLEEVLEYLKEALETMDHNCIRSLDQKKGKSIQKLVDLLNIRGTYEDLVARVDDLRKNICGARHKVDSLREMTDVISETQMFRLQEAMNSNTKSLEEMFRANERTSSSLEIMQVILSGTLAFEIIDRLTGEWSVVDTNWAQKYIVQPFIEKPGVWFMVNMGLWAVIGFMLIKFMKYLTDQSEAVLTIRIQANLPIDVAKLLTFLRTRDIGEEESDFGGQSKKKTNWQEPKSAFWKGLGPKIEIVYDSEIAFILSAYIQVNKNETTLTDEEVKDKFFELLHEHGIVPSNYHDILVQNRAGVVPDDDEGGRPRAMESM